MRRKRGLSPERLALVRAWCAMSIEQPTAAEKNAGPCPNCGHELADHAESGWGPHTVCVQKLDTFPDGGFYGVCPCVLAGGVDEWSAI